MLEKIRKRDGSLQPFNPKKIKNAILKAFQATGEGGEKNAENLTKRVVKILEERFTRRIPGVEDIQDIVEEVLMKSGFLKTARAYIVYREQHRELRELSPLFEDVRMVDKYLDEEDWLVRENSNMNFSLQGLNTYITTKVISRYWLRKIYSPEMRRAHLEGDFHIHDLGILGAYCVGWDLQDLLLTGFTGTAGKISSKPPKHFGVALGQLVNYLYTLQGESAGAQAVSNFDTLLAPFIRYDNLSYEQVKQEMQRFLFNMNVPTRVGFQTPFTNITVDLKVPKFMEDAPVIFGGKFMKDTYGDFQEEMDLLNRAFCEVMMEGDANNRVFTFPIPTYNITKEFDWDNPVFDLVLEMTAKYGIPYFANFVNSDMSPDDVRSMCCRLRLDTRDLKKRGGGLFGAYPLTGSLGVVTLNMPKIGYLSRNEDEFMDRLYRLMVLAKNCLEIKRKTIERLTERGLYPYSRFYLRNVKKTFGEYWKNHFSTIGLIGMNEALLNLFGFGIWKEEGKKFAEKVLDFMRKVLTEFQEETGNMYNLEATPAEGTSYRLAKIDKEKFGDIIVANEEEWRRGAAPFYTNSTWLPVNYTDDVFELLDHQDSLQKRYTGGTVVHVWLGEKPNPKTLKSMVKKIVSNYELPYFTFTPTFSICPIHGYIPGEHKYCPKKHTKEELERLKHMGLNVMNGVPCEVYSRVVGYLRPVNQWNDGKQAEFRLRKTFDKSLK
ncbi:MAG: ribonucleoside triphosphate reductase [Nanoarchaeota archaeon]|nr:ribonucleoside triphosphate reductase [Nanoarchaeota archaeon]